MGTRISEGCSHNTSLVLFISYGAPHRHQQAEKVPTDPSKASCHTKFLPATCSPHQTIASTIQSSSSREKRHHTMRICSQQNAVQYHIKAYPPMELPTFRNYFLLHLYLLQLISLLVSSHCMLICLEYLVLLKHHAASRLHPHDIDISLFL